MSFLAPSQLARHIKPMRASERTSTAINLKHNSKVLPGLSKDWKALSHNKGAVCEDTLGIQFSNHYPFIAEHSKLRHWRSPPNSRPPLL